MGLRKVNRKFFDNVPKYLMENDDYFRKQALELLIREVKEKRRPWGSIDPFIVALHYCIFVKPDTNIAKVLLDYLSAVLPKMAELVPRETREVGELVINAARARLNRLEREDSVKMVAKYKCSTLIAKLVKNILLIELNNEYDPHVIEKINEIVGSIEERTKEIEVIFNNDEYREIADYFFVELDRVKLYETYSANSIYDYFIKRAEQLQKDYLERRRYIEILEKQIKELQQKYNEEVNKIKESFVKSATLIMNIVTFVNIIVVVVTIALYLLEKILPYQKVTILLLSALSTLSVVYNVLERVKKVREYVKPYSSSILYWVAEKRVSYSRNGKELLKQMNNKKITIEELRKVVYLK